MYQDPALFKRKKGEIKKEALNLSRDIGIATQIL
jgi:hypothetical protein